MDLESLSPELREKAKACKSVDELYALAKQEGIELSEKDLDSVAGGWGTCPENNYCSSDKHNRYPKKK